MSKGGIIHKISSERLGLQRVYDLTVIIYFLTLSLKASFFFYKHHLSEIKYSVSNLVISTSTDQVTSIKPELTLIFCVVEQVLKFILY